MILPVVTLNGLLLEEDQEGEDLHLKKGLLPDLLLEGEKDLLLEDVLNETLDLDGLEQEVM
jgi:hypothetical protein